MDLGDRAADLAASLLASSGRRWAHVQGVGRRATALVGSLPGGEVVVAAAWLHDIGYATGVCSSGFHPLDGARWLASEGWPASVVSLVAFHTGAATEADERELGQELSAFEDPNPGQLDMLNFLDLTTSPEGVVVEPATRIAEILSRYGAEDPVHRAVTRSQDELLASAQRGELLLASGQPTKG